MSIILNNIERYVKNLLENVLPKEYTYHNLNHTIEVVETSSKISSYSKLTDEEDEILLISAWFHDTGLIKVYHGHEDFSAHFAEQILNQFSYPVKSIDMVKKIIMATKMPHKPNNLLEEILSDADIGHMGKNNFDERSVSLRTEWEFVYNKKYEEDEWLKINIRFLEENSFYTEYCKRFMDDFRIKNLTEYKNKLKEFNKLVN